MASPAFIASEIEVSPKPNINEMENGDPQPLATKNWTGFKTKKHGPLKIEMLPLRNTPSTSSNSSVATSQPAIKSINIGFKDLEYKTKEFLTRENKTILDGISGDFKAGELTAVMGPSGAGKSTLMDIISGYTTKNVLGEITINGRRRESKRFRRLSAYIMQDHNLQPLLTVIEAMKFSANLKLGNSMTKEQKALTITKILEAISLNDSRKTLTGRLSGGQKKRLSIALELVNNPNVMIFDEPTSGLDSSTSTQCMSLLKKLAMEGRTIICTIHQPSALVFEMFDHLYAIADGKCIYTGTTKNLVPFLRELDLECPKFHNPSDFLLEISTFAYDNINQNDRMVEKIENGKSHQYRRQTHAPHTAQVEAMSKVQKMMAEGLITPVRAPNIHLYDRNQHHPLPPLMESLSSNPGLTTQYNESNITNPQLDKPKNLSLQLDAIKLCKHDERYSASFIQQFLLLSQRTFLILSRHRSLTYMRIAIHLVVSSFIGMMYFQIGNEAHHIIDNFRYIFFSIMFLMFTAYSSMTMAFPLELPIVIREHFNRWYSLKAYYTATTLADFPIQLLCTLIYITITYFMTSQPLELYRFALFFAISLMVTLVAQSLGLLTGSIFSVKHAAIFGPLFICTPLIFSGFFLQISDAPSYSQWLFHISFLKYALEGAVQAIFGYNRPKMECNEMFCMYTNPKSFLKEIKMSDDNYLQAFIALIITFMIFRVLTYLVILYKLKHKR